MESGGEHENDPRFERELLAAATAVLARESERLEGWIANAVREALERMAGTGQLENLLLETVHRVYAGEPRLGGKWLEEVVEQVVAKQVSSFAWRSAVDRGDWTPGFALSGRKTALAALPGAANFRDSWEFESIPEELLSGISIDDRLARDDLPLPHTAEREGYCGEHHFDYWLGGLRDFLRLKRTLEEHGLQSPVSVLDFGCATGRVLRHALCQEPDWEAWGTDINRQHVEWVERNLPRRLKAFQATILPVLPLPDASLAIVYAFSVFTHIDDFERAWLSELRRILRPGGFAYLTIHSDDTWRNLDPEQQLYKDLLGTREHILEYDVSPELLAGPMPEPKTVFRWRSAVNNNTSVFHSKQYIHDVWGRFFDVLEIQPRATGYQDVVVLRRPE